MKMKQLFAAALLLCTTGAWAQTDVTATYIKNADFSKGTPITVGTCTYDYDMEKNGTEFCQLVPVEEWDIPANGNARAGGLIAFGSGVWIGGPGYIAPSTNADGVAEGNILGVVGVWTGTAQYTQNVTFPAGTYTLVLGVYNSVGGTDPFAKNLIGFIEDGGTEHLATTTVYDVNKWKFEFIKFTLDAETSGKISLGYQGSNVGSAKAQHLFLSGIQLFDGDVDAEAYETAKQLKLKKIAYDEVIVAATNVLNDEAYNAVIGAERKALTEEIAKAEPTTLDGYNDAIDALNAAVNTFKDAKSVYEAVPAANELAEANGLEKITVTAESSVASIQAQIDAINKAIKDKQNAANIALFNSIETDYPYELALGAWTTTGSVKTLNSQHWSGNAGNYNEPDSWSSNSGGASTWSQDIPLPAGAYALKIAGRHSGSSSLKVSIKKGEDVLCVVNDFPAQGEGRGIDIDGKAAFDDAATYANDGKGWGFEWRFLPFELTEDGAVQVLVEYESTVGQQWASFCDYVLKSQSPKEKAELLNTIAAAKAYDFTANVGTGAFQRNVTIDLSSDIDEAQSVYNTSNNQTEIINAITNLTTAFETAKDEFQNTELNAPAEGQLFNLILTFFEYQYDNMAVTYIANGRNDAGNYTIQYKAEANTNLAQAFTLTKVEGNNYLLSQIDADGEVRYVCTGTVYGGDDFQLRTTTNKEEAAQFTIIATSRDGIYNIFNLAANQYVGSQDQGVFTVNSHIDFKIAETKKAAVLVNTAEAGWGTVMLPFTKAIPEGVKAYTVESVKEDGTSLNLVPAEQLEANKPYLLEGSCNVLFEGDAQGTALTFTNGILTGTYADAAAPVASYVLQNLDSVLGFYLVADEKQPTVNANHAWLTVPEATVKAFLLGTTTGVQSVKNVEQQNAAIFNLAGQRVNKAQKGIFIQNGKKVVIK